jgi:hypothetical protein
MMVSISLQNGLDISLLTPSTLLTGHNRRWPRARYYAFSVCRGKDWLISGLALAKLWSAGEEGSHLLPQRGVHGRREHDMIVTYRLATQVRKVSDLASECHPVFIAREADFAEVGIEESVPVIGQAQGSLTRCRAEC